VLLYKLFFPEKKLEVDRFRVGRLSLVDDDPDRELYSVLVQPHDFEKLAETL
jgi:hypothetical protein